MRALEDRTLGEKIWDRTLGPILGVALLGAVVVGAVRAVLLLL